MATPAAAREFKVCQAAYRGWQFKFNLSIWIWIYFDFKSLHIIFQKCIQPEEHFRQHVENGVRPDGREDLSALRPVSISAGTIGTADGSAVVKQGRIL